MAEDVGLAGEAARLLVDVLEVVGVEPQVVGGERLAPDAEVDELDERVEVDRREMVRSDVGEAGPPSDPSEVGVGADHERGPEAGA